VLSVLPAALAQGYPSKPARILTSGGPGGNNDTQTRGLAQGLAARLGQPFVVENRAGAQGAIAGEACARAAPDGYTLCTFGNNAITFLPVLRLKMPYDPQRDLVGVAHTGYVDNLLLAHPSVPANSLTELLALAKSKPGEISWGSFGPGSSGALYTAWFKRVRGIDFLHVPYKTSAQAQQALIAGEVHVNFYSAQPALPLVKTGKLKALSVDSNERLPELPNVQTETEAGLSLQLLQVWFGMMAPAATPREILVRLNSEISQIMDEKEFQDKFIARLGIRRARFNVDQFAALLKKERAEIEKFANDIGLERQP
jgi:tripartite-type tricarboxylate transporter receptor subunit TctC